MTEIGSSVLRDAEANGKLNDHRLSFFCSYIIGFRLVATTLRTIVEHSTMRKIADTVMF